MRNRKKKGFLSRQSKGILSIYNRGYTNLTGIMSIGTSPKNALTRSLKVYPNPSGGITFNDGVNHYHFAGIFDTGHSMEWYFFFCQLPCYTGREVAKKEKKEVFRWHHLFRVSGSVLIRC